MIQRDLATRMPCLHSSNSLSKRLGRIRFPSASSPPATATLAKTRCTVMPTRTVHGVSVRLAHLLTLVSVQLVEATTSARRASAMTMVAAITLDRRKSSVDQGERGRAGTRKSLVSQRGTRGGLRKSEMRRCGFLSRRRRRRQLRQHELGIVVEVLIWHLHINDVVLNQVLKKDINTRCPQGYRKFD